MTADLYLERFTRDADNLYTRKHLTQARVLARAIDTIIIVATVGAALMTFDSVRHYGVSLFASAGVAGLVAGLAARPLLSNLFAGIQIAVAQPIRIDDSVQVENEVGSVEEITSTYVVVRLWDLRRLIVPLTYFIEKPFQNWSRESARRIGAMSLHVDYTAPVERIRAKADEIVQASPLWDGQDLKLHVTDAHERTIEVRVIASARTSGDAFELACELREKLIAFLQNEIPSALPRVRQQALSGPPPASGPDRGF
jgi:small-conductance mechanosensitive channel